jgi:hypothetical protein
MQHSLQAREQAGACNPKQDRDGGGPVAGAASGQFADDFSGAAQRQDHLAVLHGQRQDLHPAFGEDEYVGCFLAFGAEDVADAERAGLAECVQSFPFGLAEQVPEGAAWSLPALPRAAGVRHDTLAAASDFQSPRPAGSVRFKGAP